MPMGTRAQDRATLSSLLHNIKNIYSVDDGNFFMLATPSVSVFPGKMHPNFRHERVQWPPGSN